MMAFCSNLDSKTKELRLGWFFISGLVALDSVYWFYTIPNVWFLTSFFFLEGKNPEAPAPSETKISKQRKSLCYDAATKLSCRKAPSAQNVITVFTSWKKCQTKCWTDRRGTKWVNYYLVSRHRHTLYGTVLICSRISLAYLLIIETFLVGNGMCIKIYYCCTMCVYACVCRLACVCILLWKVGKRQEVTT